MVGGAGAEPYTAELTIEPGAALANDGSAVEGFAESTVTLRATRRGAPGSGLADLRLGTQKLDSGLSVVDFLRAFWSGGGVSHFDARDFGQMLFDRVLAHPNVRDRWNMIQIWRERRPLRLELILPPAHHSSISALPFELFAENKSFLFFPGPAVLVRCIRDLEPRRARIQPNDRLLVAWANPPGFSPGATDAVFETHEQSVVASGRTAGLDVLAPVARAGLTGIEEALDRARPVPLVSLMVHGYLRGGEVALEDAQRNADPVPATSITARLRAAGTQVALLWSCHSARHDADLGSLAERLIDPDGGDLAAVLASHGALQAGWVPDAARRLFRALTTSADGDLEQAIAAARQALTEKDPQWAMLAYYARPADGHSVTYEVAARAALEALEPVRRPVLESLGSPTVRIDGIPSQPHYWVDRPVEIGEVKRRIASTRAVTVRGLPGIGKTQVAREVAEMVAGDFEAGAWIALDELGSVDDLRARIASWAGLAEHDVHDWRIVKAVGTRRVLWVLDNAEDLIRSDGTGLRSFLGGIVEKCPGVALLLTSQVPLGALAGAPEETYVVRRIEDRAACVSLFATASGSPLGDRVNTDEVRGLVDMLDGHPRSLVLVAGQIRDGGANLAEIRHRLETRGDEAVLAAELLEHGDWDDHDRLRVENLVASLHLAYRRLRDSPGAAELFAWLGTLPAGLPVALAPAIFGEDAPARIAALQRFSLVELRGVDERLDLPTPVRWYAEKCLAEVAPERQAQLAARTLAAIGSVMQAAYAKLGKPGAGAVAEMSRHEERNLEALLGRASGSPELVASALSYWAMVRMHGGNLARPAILVERACALVEATGGEARAGLLAVLGHLHYRNARYTDAERAYTQACAGFAAADKHLAQANTLRSLGDLYVLTNQLEAAERTCTEARELFIAVGDRLGAANALRTLGTLYVRTTRYSAAEHAFLAARADFAALDARLNEANVLLALGELHRLRDRLPAAEEAYTAAHAAFLAIDDRLGEANALLALGHLYLRTSRLPAAEQAIAKARTEFVAIGDFLGESNALDALGDLYYRTGRRNEAERAYIKARDSFAAIDSRLGEANVLQALGDLYVRSGRFAEAALALTQARSILGAINERLGEANTLLVLADLYRRTDRLGDAAELIDAAKVAFAAIDDRTGLAQCISSKGRLEVALGRPASGFEQHRSALEIRTELEDRLGVATELAYMARAAIAAGARDRALVLWWIAQRRLRELASPMELMVAYFDLFNFTSHIDNQTLRGSAVILCWHHARNMGDDRANAIVAQLLPADMFEAGLTDDDVKALEQLLESELAEVAERLEDAGEDPMAPLPPLPTPTETP
ncbi:MAG: tetratricopeptide repeat protein [Deltaproteobacteria bacterium]|nr:tetratricopeptide repeat protein [Deltaproteobacteria bacterium]